MFKHDALKQTKNVETIIGPSVKVEGNFVGDGDVIVEGVVLGNLKTKNHLRVGQSAKIQAEIEAQSAYIAGELNGNITVEEYIELTASAKIKGDITTSLITVEKGAKINGRLTMNGPKKSEAEQKSPAFAKTFQGKDDKKEK